MINVVGFSPIIQAAFWLKPFVFYFIIPLTLVNGNDFKS